MIQQTVEWLNELANTAPLDARTLAVIIEANQQYLEYLDALMDNIQIDLSVTVQVDGQRVKFSSIEDVAQWITNK